MITRSILEWKDRKYNELANSKEEDANGVLRKAFALGVVEGGLDALAFLGATCVVVNVLSACCKQK